MTGEQIGSLAVQLAHKMGKGKERGQESECEREREGEGDRKRELGSLRTHRDLHIDSYGKC